MQLKPLPQDSQDKLKADRINEEAFPPWERSSLDDLYGSDSPEKLDMLGIYDDADMITGWYSFYDDTEFTIACSQRNFDKDGFEKFIGCLGTIISDHIPHPYRK